MGWSVCWCDEHKRWVGYGVVAYCDHKGCIEKIDRGLGYACTENHFGMNDASCGRYFCQAHTMYDYDEKTDEQICGHNNDHISDEHPEWLNHIMTDDSWSEWREKEGIQI